MQRELTAEERLEILKAADKLRTWSSLDDERRCVLCERTLSGWQIAISRDQRGRYLLKCPTAGCGSFAAHWFYVGSVADRRMSSDEYHRPTEARRGEVTGETVAHHDRPHTDSTVRLISTARKRPVIGQTQKLVLAAIRMWELKNGYRQ